MTLKNKNKDLRSTINDYIIISKPSIIWLLVFVAVTAMLVAHFSIEKEMVRPHYGVENIYPLNLQIIIGVILAGTFSSAGSAALNCYLDRDIDALMVRTKSRPTASGDMKPSNVLLYSIITIGLAITISLITLNIFSTGMIILGAFFYVVIYTIWLKKKTSWNIVIGGFAGSAAAFTGWSAITGYLEIPAIIMGILVFLWTPSHFWSLAVLKKDDYSNANIPMLPSVVGKEKAIKYIVINTLLLIPFSLLLAFYGFGMIYLGVAVLTGIGLLYTNIRMIKEPENNQIAWNAFKFSSPYLAIVFLAMVIDTIIRIPIM